MVSTSRLLFPRSCCALLALVAAVVRADEVPRNDSPVRPASDKGVGSSTGLRFESLIGLSAISAPEYTGSSQRDISVRPLAAVRVGRLRLATSSSSALLDFGSVTDQSGAMLDLVQSSRWKLRTGLRLSHGRHASESDQLAGIPDVRETALGRLSATYLPTSRWSLGSTLNFDLLGRGSGLTWTNSADYRYRLSPDSELRAAAGLTYGNATHLNSYYGVPLQSVTPTRAFYVPGAGLREGVVGLTLTAALSHQWIAFGNLSYTRLLGPAADSPLAFRKDNTAAIVGIGWRWRK